MTTKKKVAKKTAAKKVTNGNGAAKGPGVIATVIECTRHNGRRSLPSRANCASGVMR
jgi:hypothetical protein